MNRSTYWTDSIDLQDDFSGGPSQIRSIMPWNPLRSQPVRSCPTDDVCFIYQAGVSETDYKVRIAISAPGDTALERFFGCVMIGMMPDEGLDEALQALRDMLEFYSREPARPLVVQPARTVGAVVVGRRRRPDMTISP